VVLRSLQLENYRGFQTYHLTGLARVNLLVGKNNCGKTSVLEAVQLLASEGDPRVLERIASQRGEMMAVGEGDERIYPDVSHFFNGHGFHSDISLSIGSDDPSQRVQMRIVDVSQLERRQLILFEEPTPFARATDPLSGPREVLAIQVESARASRLEAFPVSSDGALLFYERRSIRVRSLKREDFPSVRFITPESLEPRHMSRMWDKVITDGREAEVIEAMRILEPKLANIFFLSSQSASRYARMGILAAFEDLKRKRVPLGSFGEGMRRLLALALSLNDAEGGILLIDEIDTGLHYSILGDMWLLLVNAAKQYDTQVFATTHSLDCLRGLAWLCERHPELASEISVQKIDPCLEQSVNLDSETLQIAIKQDLEVR
jgi:predicted ATPase